MSTQALYRFFNAQGELLYVGISLTPVTRLQQHRSDKPWWAEVANVTIECQPDRRSALQAEKAAIIRERPAYNITHNHAMAGAQRMAVMLDRLPDDQIPDLYLDACSVCGVVNKPIEVSLDRDGGYAVFDCCGDNVWTKAWDE